MTQTTAVDSDLICALESVSVTFPTRDGTAICAVHEASLVIRRGEAVAIVGESGSGKSTLALSILGLVPDPGVVTGTVVIDGRRLAATDQRGFKKIRGRKVGLILQDAVSSMNPVRTLGSQLQESARQSGMPKDRFAGAIRRGLEEVGLEPDVVMGQYAWQLSGGMNQRVAIAMALLQEPELLIADEPTSALDVTIQASILQLMNRLRQSRGMAMLLVSHDLGVVNRVAEKIGVMYAGDLVEFGSTDRIINEPEHPYSRGLVRSVAEFDTDLSEEAGIPGQLQRMYEGDDFCPFAARCPRVMPRCRERRPVEKIEPDGHRVSCWAVGES